MSATPTLDALEVLKPYPNLAAIMEGRVSGDVTEWPAIRAELTRLCGFFSEERTLVSSLQGGIVEQTVRADEAEAARERQRELKMEAHARASELRTELEDVEAECRALRSYAVQLAGALTDDALVREIAMQVRHYTPVNEANVRELLDDVRQGIAIYLEEHGMTKQVAELAGKGCATCKGTRWITSHHPGSNEEFQCSCPDCDDGMAELVHETGDASPGVQEYERITERLRHQSCTQSTTPYMDTPHYRVNKFVSAMEVVHGKRARAGSCMGFDLRTEDLADVVRTSAPLYTGECVHQVGNVPTWADGMERAATLCDEEEQNARSMGATMHADEAAALASTIRAFKAAGPEMNGVTEGSEFVACTKQEGGGG